MPKDRRQGVAWHALESGGQSGVFAMLFPQASSIWMAVKGPQERDDRVVVLFKAFGTQILRQPDPGLDGQRLVPGDLRVCQISIATLGRIAFD